MLNPPTPLPGARFRVHSDDPTFQVRWLGGARFALSGEVSSTPSADLDVDTPSDSFEIPLAQRSTAEHAVAALQRTLPRGVLMTRTASDDGIEVLFHEALVPAAMPPRLRIISTDLSQRVRQLDENAIEFVGSTGGDCLLTILCDRRRSTISIPGGTSGRATAARVAASMPLGYRALVDGAIVRVWKDADFFSMVA
jgi:hypothetical protein